MKYFELNLLAARAEELFEILQHEERMEDLFCMLYTGEPGDVDIEHALLAFDDDLLVEFNDMVDARTMNAKTDDDILKPGLSDDLKLLLRLRLGCVIYALEHMLEIYDRTTHASTYHLALLATTQTELLYWGLTRFALECRDSYYAYESIDLRRALLQWRGQSPQ